MLSWFADRWNDFIDFMYRCILTVTDALRDTLIWLFDSTFNLLIYAVDGLGSMFNGLNFTQYMALIPDETKQILAITGISEAMTMVITCIIIRILLQLIPFVRLGS